MRLLVFVLCSAVLSGVVDLEVMPVLSVVAFCAVAVCTDRLAWRSSCWS